MIDDAFPLLGIDIGGTRARAAVVRGAQIIAAKADFLPQEPEPREQLRFVADLARGVLSELDEAKDIAAAGIACAALVDERGGVIQWPNRPAWRGLPIRTLLEEWLGMPIQVDDDANAAALGEWLFGAGQGYHHALVMTVGTGIGAGLILDGQLFRGRNGWAGELGHVVVQPDGPSCPCGHRGCLQTVASGRVLEQVAQARGLKEPSAIMEAAQQGEAWATQLLASCGRWLGIAAANVANLLNLEAVVIGGGLSVIGNAFWASLQEAFDGNLLNRTYQHVKLHRAELPDTAGLLGAAYMAQSLVLRKDPHGRR